MNTDEPIAEFEPETLKDRLSPEAPMLFFTDHELGEMWRENQDESRQPREPESIEEAAWRCLGSYREW